MELTFPMQQKTSFLVAHKNKILIALVVLLAAIVWMQMVSAGTAATGVGSSFATWAKTIEDWIKGSFGKLALLVALLFAIGAFAITRDLKVIVIPVVGAVGVGIVVSLITGSFTALI